MIKGIILPSLFQNLKKKKKNNIRDIWRFLCHAGSSWQRQLLIVLGFNNTSTLVGHFESSPREREKRDRRDSRGDERDREERVTRMKVKKQKK